MIQATISRKTVQKILNGLHSNPFTVLGMHETITPDKKKMLVVRAFLPDVQHVSVYDMKQKKRYPMTRLHEDGVFEVVFSRRRKKFAYQLEISDSQGKSSRCYDPYALPPVLSDSDLELFHAGKHYHIYEHLGCHLMDVQGIAGVLFALWAPHAKGVSVVGDFNNWSGKRHAMRLRKKWGVWELFVPAVAPGSRYQYEIITQNGEIYTKSDPYGVYFEQAPKNRSIVTNINHFRWNDQQWMTDRAAHAPESSPISVYEVHLGSWLKKPDGKDGFLSYQELATELIPYVKEMGFTHLELLPVAEHPFYGSWGYQVTGYYAPTSRYGTPQDFKYFINECHRQGLGVIVDWVPAHFPKDDFSLGYFDGTYLYEHADPRLGEHKDWGTLIFDYGRNEVKNFLFANALFWFDHYHIDGIRVDAVASMLYLDYSRREGEWVPNKYGGRENLEAIEFLKELNTLIHQRFPGTMSIAEESTSWLGVTYPTYLGGLDFTFKWNLGWMNDILHYLSHDPLQRKFVHTMVPFTLHYAFHEHFMLELSHDEVVHGKGSLLAKMPGDDWQKFANLRLLYGFMFGHPGKKFLFMGAEFAQWSEWSHDRSLEWSLLQYGPHQGIQRFVRDLNHLYTSEPALYQDDTADQCFEWIDYHDYENSVFSFLRKTVGYDGRFVVFICNFTPVTRDGYRVGVPTNSYYREQINSDAKQYGGKNIGNVDGCLAKPIPWQQQPYSITLTLPPLSVVILQPLPRQEGEKKSPDINEPKTTPARQTGETLPLVTTPSSKRQGIKIFESPHPVEEDEIHQIQPQVTVATPHIAALPTPEQPQESQHHKPPITPLSLAESELFQNLQNAPTEQPDVSSTNPDRWVSTPPDSRNARPQGTKAAISKNREGITNKRSSGC